MVFQSNTEAGREKTHDPFLAFGTHLKAEYLNTHKRRAAFRKLEEIEFVLYC